MVHVALLQFYEKAPTCKELSRDSYGNLTCQLTKKPCGPRHCPTQDFSDLFPSSVEVPIHDSRSLKGPVPEPQLSSIPHVTISRLQPKQNPSLLEFSKEKQTDKLKRSHVTISRKRQQIVMLNCKIIRRKTRKNYTRPKVKSSTKSTKCLITFSPPKSDSINRWRLDVLFGGAKRGTKRKKVTIFEFSSGEKSPTARFYFPTETSAEAVREVVESWFQQQIGTPIDYSIDFAEI